MRDPHARAAQALHFAAVEMDAVRQPGIGAQPSDVLQQVQRPLAEAAQAVGLFIARLGQVRMQAHAVPASQVGARAHQFRRHGKRRARRQREAQHGARRGIVILRDQALAVLQNPRFVLHHRIRRQAAFAPSHAHAAARRMEPHADAARRFNLRVDQVGVAARKQVVVVAGGGAARKQQLRHAGQRRHVDAFLIHPRPNRVERAQPVEQLRVGRGSVGARQGLVQMMVRIDQAGQRDGMTAVDHAVRLRQLRRAASHTPDLAVLGVDVPAVKHAVLRVHQ